MALKYTWTMIMSSDLRTGRHCVSNIHVHLVFVTKYRKTVFEKIHFVTMKMIFEKVCADFKSELVEIDGEADHVHLLIRYPPRIPVSKLVNSLKGVSSRLMKKHHPELLKLYCKGVLCGHRVTSPLVVAVRLSQLFINTLNNKKHQVEPLRGWALYHRHE